MEEALEKPETKRQLRDRKEALAAAYADAAEAGLLFIKSGGNSLERASRIGRPESSRMLTNGVPGPFEVVSVDIGDPNDPDDDRIGPQGSSRGPNEGAAPGTRYPVGEKDSNGWAKDLTGSSFATPAVAATAQRVMSEILARDPDVSPESAVRKTFAILQDPRVLTRIHDAERVAPGQVDPVRAVMVARAPGLTERQIDRYLARLEHHPTAQFRLEPNGALRVMPD